MNSYLELLNTAWADHLRPKPINAPTVISTFAGAGGSSLGYSMAGYRELLSVEWDDNAVEVFRRNFPEVPVYHGDITKLSVAECIALAGLTEPGELDVFDGSPPCQGFSTAGKRNMADDRNQLFREYVRLLRGLQPKVFVMENVSGMVKGKMKLIFADIIRELKGAGYVVSARLLNAMYFNVPQSRERMIFIGVRQDLGIRPTHPKAENQPRIIGNMLQDLANMEQDEATCHIWQNNSPLANARIAMVKEGGKLSDSGYSFNSAYRRIARNSVSPTLTRGGSIGVSASGSSWYSHYALNRPLSVREGARIASFPDGFAFIGAPYQGCCRIGNSVPPLFMRAIAAHIRKTILEPYYGQAN